MQSPSAILEHSIARRSATLGVREASSPKAERRPNPTVAERRQMASSLSSVANETADAFIVRSAAGSTRGAGGGAGAASPFAARHKTAGAVGGGLAPAVHG
eukprot:5260475-Prymnesium_polylepis.1